MTISVEKIQLWRGEVDDRPGVLAKVLERIDAGASGLDVIMGYSYPGGDRRKAVLELFPVLGRAAEDAARQAGLSPSTKPTLLIRGGDRLGLMTLFYRAVEDEGINIDFLVAQALGDEFSVVIGLATDAEAEQAAAAIERLAKER